MMQQAQDVYCHSHAMKAGRQSASCSKHSPHKGKCQQAEPAGAALRTSALVIAGLNTVGFIITAITKSHKITDLTVRPVRAQACRQLCKQQQGSSCLFCSPASVVSYQGQCSAC